MTFYAAVDLVINNPERFSFPSRHSFIMPVSQWVTRARKSTEHLKSYTTLMPGVESLEPIDVVGLVEGSLRVLVIDATANDLGFEYWLSDVLYESLKRHHI